MDMPPAVTPSDLRALALYRHSLDLDDAERSAWLARLRSDDPHAHAAVLALAAAGDSVHPLDEPLRHPPASHAAHPAPEDDARPGTRLGPWRVDRLVAEGGMGSVYEAHRDDGQYEQRVALKCMRIGLDTDALVDAFLTERNHLARLEHPHIATLLDGGVDAGGHPWFAMQYIDGLSIDAWCDDRKLTLRQRAELFLQVCAALACAHGQGILHQDIKPSNIMVDEAGEVKLLDFGLSSRLAPGARADAPPLAMTPGYTAPEIALQGGRPSVASDIHSLGIVLCRVLCGTIPTSLLLHQLSQLADDAGVRRLPDLVRDVPPETARLRGLADNAALARQLAGDLEAIVARCIDPQPDHRYGAASELAQDLRCWLEQRPVAARRGDWRYRSGLFVRRHRLALGLAGALVLSLGVGAGAMLWQSYHAAREARATLAASRLFEETLGLATLSGLGETPFSSADLLRRTEARMRAMQLERHANVQARALNVLANGYATIGDYRHATLLAEEAAHHLSSAEAQATLASLLNLQARYAEAGRTARDALSTLDADKDAHGLRLGLLNQIARSQWGMAERDDAQKTLDTALAEAQRDAAHDPAPYVELLITRAQWRQDLGLFGAAETDLRQAIALAGTRYPVLADDARQDLVQALRLMDVTEEAEQIARQSLQSRRSTLGEAHPKTGLAWLTLARSQLNAGRGTELAESLARASAILRATYGERHPAHADVLMLSAWVHRSANLSSYQEAVADFRRAVAIVQEAYGPGHSRTLNATGRLGDLLMTAPATLDAGERARYQQEGIGLLEKTVADARRLKMPLPNIKLPLVRGLATRNAPGDLARARALLEEVRGETSAIPPDYLIHRRTQFLYALTHYAARDFTRADAELEQLTGALEASLPKLTARLLLLNALWLRASIAVETGQPEQARVFLVQRHALAERLLGADHATTRAAQRRIEEFDRTGQVPFDQAAGT